MSQEQSQFHPVIEELVVIEGQDAGRIKDVGFAQEVAAPMNGARDVGDHGFPSSYTAEDWKQDDHDYVSYKIAQTALKQPWNNKNHNEPINYRTVGRQLTEIRYRKKAK